MSWLPLHVVFLLEVFGVSHSRGIFFAHMGAQFLTYANACMNPLIYVFLLKNFWNAALATLQCRHAMFRTHQHNAQRVRNGIGNANANNTTDDPFGGTRDYEDGTPRRFMSDKEFMPALRQSELDPSIARGRFRSLDANAADSGVQILPIDRRKGLELGLLSRNGRNGKNGVGNGPGQSELCTPEGGGPGGSTDSMGGLAMRETTRTTICSSPNTPLEPDLRHFRSNTINSHRSTQSAAMNKKLDRENEFELEDCSRAIQEAPIPDNLIHTATATAQTCSETRPKIEHLYKKRFSLRFSDEPIMSPSVANGKSDGNTKLEGELNSNAHTETFHFKGVSHVEQLGKRGPATIGSVLEPVSSGFEIHT